MGDKGRNLVKHPEADARAVRPLVAAEMALRLVCSFQLFICESPPRYIVFKEFKCRTKSKHFVGALDRRPLAIVCVTTVRPGQFTLWRTGGGAPDGISASHSQGGH